MDSSIAAQIVSLARTQCLPAGAHLKAQGLADPLQSTLKNLTKIRELLKP